MKIIVSGSHLVDFPEMEGYATEKVARLSRYHHKIEKISVRLTAERAHRNEEHDFTCEIIVAVPGRDVEVVERDRFMDKAIDKALERMKRTLIKAKEKSVSKKHKEGILAKLLSRF